MADKVEAYLQKKKNTATSDAVAENFQTLENYYVQKLWHQLTLEVKQLVVNPAFTNSVDLKELYDNFIHEFEHRINAVYLVEIVMPVAQFIFLTNKEEAFEFLKKIEKTVAKDQQASIRVVTGEIELRLECKDANGRCENIQKIRKMVEDTQKLVDDLPGVTPIHSSFYKVSAQYLKEVGNYAAYYREALRYLGCENLSSLSRDELHRHALLLGIAALLGENIYNFGELLVHPILEALNGTNESWLVEVLLASNSGDINKFRQFEKHWSIYTDVKANQEFLEGKIRLLCLMEIAMARPSKKRYITFDEISKRALLPENKVEFLVMKALSKGLVRGSIDQVNKSINITWVEPRVLSRIQIKELESRIGTWSYEIGKFEKVIGENAKELLVK